jgi:hypothetical protein
MQAKPSAQTPGRYEWFVLFAKEFFASGANHRGNEAWVEWPKTRPSFQRGLLAIENGSDHAKLTAFLNTHQSDPVKLGLRTFRPMARLHAHSVS